MGNIRALVCEYYQSGPGPEPALTVIPRTPSTQTISERRTSLTGLAGIAVPATVTEVGVGPGVTFLHGLVGLNDHWEEVAQRLEGRVRSVMLELPLLDLRGRDCSIEGVAALTERFLDQHLDGPTILVGNSFGGHVALHLALRRPELVRGLVLAGSSGLIERSTVRDVQVRPSREWLAEKIGELFFDRQYVREADLDRAHAELSQRRKARAMVRLSRTARRNHLGDELRRIATPTLLIWGEQDIVTPPEAARGFLDRLPNARIEWFEECGHVPMVEKPDEFARALLGFVEELGPAR